MQFKQDSFYKGTFILTMAGIVVKIIGSLNWIFVSRILGGEGIGLYQMAFPIYLMALSISSAGIPVAISIITAERVALGDVLGARRIFRIALGVLSVSGLLLSLATYVGAEWLIDWRLIRDPRAYYSIVALAPAIFFVTMLSSFRGYLQGWQRMTPTAVSQIVEQIFRVVTMILFAQMLLPSGLEFAAAGASLGAFAGAVAGFVVLVYYHLRLEREIAAEIAKHASVCQGKKEPCCKIIKRILVLAIPVSASSLMLPIVSNLDLMIVPARLEVAGLSIAEATEYFGYLTGMAVPLTNLATILTAALAVSLVPAISEAAALGDKVRIAFRTGAAIRISNIITFPAFVLIFMLHTEIATLIYNAPLAGPVVGYLATAIVFLGLHQVTTGILQGLGHTTIPLVNMAVAAVAKVALNWSLVAIPTLGIIGATVATTVDIGLAALINLYFIRRYVGTVMRAKELMKVVCASLVMAGSVYLAYHALTAVTMHMAVVATGATLVGIGVYLGVLLLIGGICREDVAGIPHIGTRLVHIFCRIGVFR